MLEQDVAIGDYFEFGDENFGIKKDTRESMIKLMERLCDIKAYKEDTLYLSISLADRYLLYLAKANKPAPVLVSLGAITVFIAAKLNETPCPSLDLIIDIIRFKQKKPDWKQKLIDLEEKIIKALQFNLMLPTQMGFLDRYLRIFGMDKQVREQKYARTIRDATQYLCRYMIRDSSFLIYKPCQMAAVSLLAAMNAQSALFRHQARQQRITRKRKSKSKRQLAADKRANK